MRAGRFALATAVLLGVLAAPAFAYPKVLGVAIDQAYSPKKIHLDEICYKHIRGKLYVLASVDYVRTDKPSANSQERRSNRATPGPRSCATPVAVFSAAALVSMISVASVVSPRPAASL